MTDPVDRWRIEAERLKAILVEDIDHATRSAGVIENLKSKIEWWEREFAEHQEAWKDNNLFHASEIKRLEEENQRLKDELRSHFTFRERNQVK